MILKIKAVKAGGHWHVGFWMGKTEGALGKSGDLIFREEEWPVFRQCITTGYDARILTIEEVRE